MKNNNVRVRYSVRQLEQMHKDGNTKPLDDLIRAWKGIKELPPEDLNSFFNLAGYHGEPFTGGGAYNAKYWGGYCNHGNVLFPTWHRVYVLKIEEALQSIEGCEDVMMPYWDETSEESLKDGIPEILTKEQVELDGKTINNPLISYTFPVQVDDLETDPVGAYAYTKPAGYTTVRYPLSGLVGTEEARIKTLIHNDKYPDYDTNVKLLNTNVKGWLNAGPTSPPTNLKKAKALPPDGSIHRKYIDCLDAPNYTLFSNTTSAGAFHDANPKQRKVTPLESPHNDVHLSVGGYDFPGFESGLIADSNGDMGENNTASFDPIFFFHHCNVDRMFWLWQKRNGKTDDFEIDSSDEGAKSGQGQGPTPNFPWDSVLSMDSPLNPFMISPLENQRIYTSRDVINIEKQLGFTYSEGSLEEDEVAPVLSMAKERSMKEPKVLKVSGINRELFTGSFIIAAYAQVGDEKILLGTESILSRWSVKQCANCLNHLEVQAHFSLDKLTDKQIHMAEFSIDIRSREKSLPAGLEYKLEVI
ncbi:MAG: tyrosinase family protein [Bacteroidota bacterium]